MTSLFHPYDVTQEAEVNEPLDFKRRSRLQNVFLGNLSCSRSRAMAKFQYRYQAHLASGGCWNFASGKLGSSLVCYTEHVPGLWSAFAVPSERISHWSG